MRSDSSMLPLRDALMRTAVGFICAIAAAPIKRPDTASISREYRTFPRDFFDALSRCLSCRYNEIKISFKLRAITPVFCQGKTRP
jgi:hypothetical protein